MAVAAYKVRDRLPVAYNTAIGRTVARFAVIEARLRRFIYSLLEVNSTFGRIAVRNPRVEDSLNMIQELMALREFDTRVEFKGETGLISICKRLERFRDMVAHGVWVFHGKSPNPILQVTAGSYVPDQGQKPVKARIIPQALNVSLAMFRHHAEGMTVALHAIDELGKDLNRQHKALRKKRALQQSRDQSPADRPGGQIPAKRQPRRKSSQG